MQPSKRIVEILKGGDVGCEIAVSGWVRTRRESKAGLTFIEVNDGSCLSNLQVVAETSLPNYDAVTHLSTGSSVEIAGDAVSNRRLKARPLSCERPASPWWVRPPTTSLCKRSATRTSISGQLPTFRARSNTFGAVARVRNEISRSIHGYFQDSGYLYVNSPIITAIDAEGAGDMFRVTTMDLNNIPKSDGVIDFKRDIFERPAYLAVSGQLEGEIMATAMGSVYTFAPTFRAKTPIPPVTSRNSG